jgi:hypothetical protein
MLESPLLIPAPGELSEAQRARLMKAINARWRNVSCEVCHSNAWTINPSLFYLSAYSGPNIIIGGPRVPLVCVSCTVCGNTKLLNAISLGLVNHQTGEVVGG